MHVWPCVIHIGMYCDSVCYSARLYYTQKIIIDLTFKSIHGNKFDKIQTQILIDFHVSILDLKRKKHFHDLHSCVIHIGMYLRGYAFCMVFHVKWIFLTTSLRISPESRSDEGGIRRRVVRNPSHMENHIKCIFSHTLHFNQAKYNVQSCRS